ncbi:hypothetical protein JCM10449v2_003786 [Rhodotorula kratochvilovae]
MSRAASPAPSRLASSPSTPRSSARRSTQPTRMKHAQQQHHHHHKHQQQPGLLSLPQSPKLDSPPAPSLNPANPSPLPSAELDHAKADDGRRRRRAKQNRAESPLKHGAALDSSADEAHVAHPEGPADATAATPTKSSRRRRGKASRQPSPPPTEGVAIPALEQPVPSFPSTSPPQTDLSALAHHSRSVPPDPFLQPPRFDAWDMPTVAAAGDAPKQNLSWQQELLRSGSVNSHTGGRGKGDSPVARPRSRDVAGRDARTGGSSSSASSSTTGKARPPLHASLSESGTTGAGPSLNWQQELLLQMDPAAIAQQQPAANTTTGLTPARQRRNQIKDSITFGLTNLDLSEDDSDVFASPGARRSGQPSRGRTQPSSAVATGFSTPTKPQQLVEPRYAGPTFHNSPAPSSLPTPSFMRRKVDVVAA